MKKKKRGGQKLPSELKKKRVTVRVYPKNLEVIEAKFGSVQKFMDAAVKTIITAQ